MSGRGKITPYGVAFSAWSTFPEGKATQELLAAGCDGVQPLVVPTSPPSLPSSVPTNPPVAEPTTPSSPYLPGDAYNCSDFATYAEAKAYFDAVPGDPSNLDGNNDGVPCESLPGAPSAVSNPPSSQAPANTYLPGDAYNCGDFSSYMEAKTYFDAVPGDPSRLDGDNDGIPCESLPGAP